MSQSSDRGFVDFISEINVYKEMGDTNIVGIIDLYLCATCLEQASRLVGCASAEETLGMAQMVIDRDEEIEKLKDEIFSWQQRFVGMANLTPEDFEDLRRLERERLNPPPPADDPPPPSQ